MRIRIAGFSVSAVVLGAWFGPAVFGQQNGKFAASQDGSGEPVYGELAKAPDKARGKLGISGPASTIRKRWPPAGIYSSNTARSATVKVLRAAKKGRTFAWRKFRMPSQAQFSGF